MLYLIFTLAVLSFGCNASTGLKCLPAEQQSVSEETYILNIIHGGTMANRTSIEKIKKEYISRSQQESVLGIRNEVCVSFTNAGS
jgi:hypothetical protein